MCVAIIFDIKVAQGKYNMRELGVLQKVSNKALINIQNIMSYH